LETEGYLAYDRGKVAVVGLNGVYVLVLDSILDQLEDIRLRPKDASLRVTQQISEHKQSWPNLRLREVKFKDLKMFRTEMILCLQLTETKLYVSVLFG
jgi:hypothetical protein